VIDRQPSLSNPALISNCLIAWRNDSEEARCHIDTLKDLARCNTDEELVTALIKYDSELIPLLEKARANDCVRRFGEVITGMIRSIDHCLSRYLQGLWSI
jgi:hypothetical protein